MAEPYAESSRLLLKKSVTEKPAGSLRSFEEWLVLKGAVSKSFEAPQKAIAYFAV